MFQRIGLFLLTNLAVLVVLGIVINLFGLQSYTNGQMNLPQMLIICAVVGFTGSFISLALSKWMALRSVNGRKIENPSSHSERWLVSTVHELARKANIGLPEVAIYDSPDANAFATGMNKNKALVAVSTGLLSQMNEDEVKAVLAHEVAHITNGDMVTMALIQGVVNTFVMFAARLVGNFIDKAILGNRDGQGIGYFVSVIVCEIVFGIAASTIVLWFSRRREFRADAGSAQLYNTQAMVSALRKLQRIHEPEQTPKQMEVFAISGQKARFGKLFMSHPPLEERIAALENIRAA